MRHAFLGRMTAASLALLLAISFARGGPANGEQLALLVGVRKYDPTELRDLPYAEADMEALSRTLINAGYQSRKIDVPPSDLPKAE